MGANNQLENATIFACPNWEAIWAGVFTFIAIWAGFGALALDIPRGATRSSVLFAPSADMALWAVLLAIGALFCAGRITGWLASTTNRYDGILHCIVMFCFAIASALVMLFLNGVLGGVAGSGTMDGINALDIFSYPGWPLFFGVLFGWLAVISGAATARGGIPVQMVMREMHGS